MRERGTSGSMAVEPGPGAKAARSCFVGGRKTGRVRRVERSEMPGRRQPPANAGRLEAGAFPILPTAASFSVGRLIAWVTFPRPTTPKNADKRRRGWAILEKQYAGGADGARPRPTTPERTRAPDRHGQGSLKRPQAGAGRSAAASDRSRAAGAADARMQHGEGSGWRPARCGEERAAEEGRNAQRPPPEPPARVATARPVRVPPFDYGRRPQAAPTSTGRDGAGLPDSLGGR